MVLEKCMINVLAVRNLLEEFLGSASLENSKQRDKDAQFFATVSSSLHVEVIPFSLTEVIWICNFVQKERYLWFVLPYGVA